MKIITEAVQNLVVYMLLITVILNLLKTSSYKKYIELFTGLVLILILFTPMARLFLGESTFEDYLEKNQFRLETMDSAEFIYETEENTKEELLRLYTEKVTERIYLLGEKHEIVVEKAKIVFEPAEDGFGSIEKIRVWVADAGEKKEFCRVLSEAFEIPEKKIVVK